MFLSWSAPVADSIFPSSEGEFPLKKEFAHPMWVKYAVCTDVTKADAKMLINDTTSNSSTDTRNLITLESQSSVGLNFRNRTDLTKDWTIKTSSNNASFLISRADMTNTAFFMNHSKLRFKDNSNVTLMEVDVNGMTIAGSVYNTSSRSMKDNITEVNAENVLDKLSELMIAKWNYTKDGEGIKHIGPIAEDFYAMFGLGRDDKHIATLDTSGVAIAAIQALNGKLKKKNKEIKQLEQNNKDLNDRLLAIESALKQLKR